MRTKKSNKSLSKPEKFHEEARIRHRVFWIRIAGAFFFILAVTTMAYFLLQIPWIFLLGKNKLSPGTYTNTGSIGDTYGGLLGPPIAFIAAILTFAAFYMQFKANQLQRTGMRDQEKNWLFERFESRFFELLKLHKDNVNEMSAAGYQGRRCFRHYYNELRFAFDLVSLAKKEYVKNHPSFQGISILPIAYHLFFYGFGSQSENVFVEDAEEMSIEFFKSHMGLSGLIDVMLKEDNVFMTVPDYPFKESTVRNARNLLYSIRRGNDHFSPLQGNTDRLGHYYRHMYQTAKYVSENEVLEDSQKREFLKTFRAQLSNFEQLMLFYNGYLWFPEKWGKLFTKYQFIKNVPIEACVFEDVTPTKVYYNEMILLYITQNRNKMFEGQSDLTEEAERWIKNSYQLDKQQAMQNMDL